MSVTVNNKKDLDALKELDKNYIVIELNYSNTIILPYEKAMQFLDTLDVAESYEYDSNSGGNKIVSLNMKLGLQIISAAEYREIKVINLLGATKQNE